MKCPKCQYIGFDQQDRCRNCGYEFSLSPDPEELDLPIRSADEAIGPFADFALDADGGRQSAEIEPVLDRSARSDIPSTELPLFHGRGFDDDAPLVSLPSSPRAPVSVRKSAGARAAAQRQPAEEPTLDLEPEEPSAPTTRRAGAGTVREERRPEVAGEIQAASAGARLLGALLDLLLLGSIDVTILYLTLRLLGLRFADAALLPLVPFIAFIALLNGGYVAAFTAAGGQTLGKMAARIKVITADEHAWSDRVPLGQAVVRAAAYALSALPAGLGFLPALFASDRRALHDRLAHTRVVRA